MLPAVDRIVKNIKPKYDDDCIDRLNYAYTSGFFVILILVIGAKQYVGEPLQCWMNAEFKGSWEKYIENYCFVENTYYVSFEKDYLPAEENRKPYELRYYQWVPIILTLQLLLLLVPKTFWSAVSWKTGLNVRAIIGNLSHTERQKKLMAKHKGTDENSEARLASKYLQSTIAYNQNRRDKYMGVFPHSTYNNYLTVVYLVYKFLNCVNTGAQLYIMNNFINTSYTFWGIGILTDLISRRDWKSSGNFPRVTYCDFMRRDDTTSKPMTFTVQCVLMINMFNEKLYIVLWFWFVTLTILNIVNFLYWLITSLTPAYSHQFITAQLNFGDRKNFTDEDVHEFIKARIPRDGITALRLLAANAGDLVSSDCIVLMYADWRKETEKERKNVDHKKPDPHEYFLNNNHNVYAPAIPSKNPNGFDEPQQFRRINEFGDQIHSIQPHVPQPHDD